MKSRVSEKSGGSKTKLNVKKKQSTPLRSIFCLKNKANLKEIEKKEDCFILDFNPDDSLRKLPVSNNNIVDSADISIVAEKGQVFYVSLFYLNYSLLLLLYIVQIYVRL